MSQSHLLLFITLPLTFASHIDYLKLEAETSKVNVEVDGDQSMISTSRMYTEDVLSLDFTINTDNGFACIFLHNFVAIDNGNNLDKSLMFFIDGSYLTEINLTSPNSFYNTSKSFFTNVNDPNISDVDIISNQYQCIRIQNGDSSVIIYLDSADSAGVSVDYVTLGIFSIDQDDNGLDGNLTYNLRNINNMKWILTAAASDELTTGAYSSWLHLYAMNDIGWKPRVWGGNGNYYVVFEMYSGSYIIYAFHLKYPKLFDGRIRCQNHLDHTRYNWTVFTGYMNEDGSFSGWTDRVSENYWLVVDLEWEDKWEDGLDMWSDGYYLIKVERTYPVDTKRSHLIGCTQWDFSIDAQYSSVLSRYSGKALGPLIYQTNSPTLLPTSEPSQLPTIQPSQQPSNQPSTHPSSSPTSLPSTNPSSNPSTNPSTQPSTNPSTNPSLYPSILPSSNPTIIPSKRPSIQPSNNPSFGPTTEPTDEPTGTPITVTVDKSGSNTNNNNNRDSLDISYELLLILMLIIGICCCVIFVIIGCMAFKKYESMSKKMDDEKSELIKKQERLLNSVLMRIGDGSSGNGNGTGEKGNFSTDEMGMMLSTDGVRDSRNGKGSKIMKIASTSSMDQLQMEAVGSNSNISNINNNNNVNNILHEQDKNMAHAIEIAAEMVNIRSTNELMKEAEDSFTEDDDRMNRSPGGDIDGDEVGMDKLYQAGVESGEGGVNYNINDNINVNNKVITPLE